MSSKQTSPTMAAATTPPTRELRGFWRLLFAVLAPVAPLAAMIADIIQPWKYSAEPTDIVSAIAANPSPERGVIWLHVVSAGLFIVGIIAVAWVTRRRAPLLTAIGGLLSAFAILIQAQLPSIDLLVLVGVDNGLDHTALATLITGLDNHPTAALGIIAFVFGHVLGQVLIGAAIWRSRVAPWWLGLALIVSGPLQMVGGATDSVPLAAAGWCLNAGGFAAASIALLRTSNSEFDLVPL